MAFGLFKKKEDKIPANNTDIVTLKVKEVVSETKDAVSIHFEHPKDNKIIYKPGQFFTLIVEVNGKKERRAYSVCSSPVVDESPAVAVKRVEGGKVSNYLNDHVKAGDSIDVLLPMGNFTTDFDGNNERDLLLLGGGSGITPLISIAKSTLAQEPKTAVTLLYANRNENSVIFLQTLAQLEKEYNRFKVIHIWEENADGKADHTGYISSEIIGEFFQEKEASQVEVFVCGPAPMMEVAIAGVKSAGVLDGKVHKESFTSDSTEASTVAENGEIRSREVTVHYDGEVFKYTVGPDETILEKGLDEDIDLPFSCQSGLCTACRGKCLSGKVKMDESEGLSDAELEEGYVLPCVSHPLTDDVVIEIG